MKKFTLVIVPLIAFLFVSCKKDKEPLDTNYYMRASKNNASWNVDSWAYFTPLTATDTLEIRGIDKNEQLQILLKMGSNKQYQIDNHKTIFMINYSSANYVTYKLDVSAVNAVTMTKIDLNNRVIAGNFNLKFKKVFGDVTYPDTVKFKNGEFKSTQVVAFSL